MKIYLRTEDYNKILAHSKAQAPNEACGLLAGHEDNDIRTVEKIYILSNTDNSPEHFTLDPKEQLQAVKDMRINGLRLLGNWHSHPASPSRPSQEDIRLAFDKNISYLILSLMNNPELNAFHIENGISSKEELILTGGIV